MSIESQIFAALASLVGDRVYRDAPPDTVTTYPLITFAQVGGEAINFVDSATMPGKRNARLQINVWGETRDAVMALAASVEDSIRATIAMSPTVLGAAVALYEPDAGVAGAPLYGARQDFSVWG